jgi:hypothetical protein
MPKPRRGRGCRPLPRRRDWRGAAIAVELIQGSGPTRGAAGGASGGDERERAGWCAAMPHVIPSLSLI